MLHKRILIALFVICVAGPAAASEAQSEKAKAPTGTLRPTPISAELAERHERRMAALKPAVKSWAKEQAEIEEKRGRLDLNALEAAVRERVVGSFPRMDAASNHAYQSAVTQVEILILMMMVTDANKELQQKMQEMQQQMAQKAALRQTLNEMNTEMAAALGTGRTEHVSGACTIQFCKSLPGKVTEVNASVDRLKPASFRSKYNPHLNYTGVLQQQGRVTLDSDAVSYEQVRDLKLQVMQLLGDLSSDADMNAELQTEVQLAQQTYTQAAQMESNIMKSDADAEESILANLK